MSAAAGLRKDLTAARRFLRRLEKENHDDPVAVPPLPPAEVIDVPGRGEMFFRKIPGPEGAPTVVLLHGWTLSADLNWFSGPYDVAARHGPVLAPDLRGHGRGLRSDRPLSLEALAEDVAALIEHNGAGPAVLVGYSLGGSLGLLVWRHHREQVAGLVLASTALQWRKTLLERAIWSSMAAVEYGFRLGAPEGGMVDRYLRMAVEQSPDFEPYKAWVKGEIRRGDPSDIAAAGRGLSAFDATGFAAEVDVPTAVVVTARDRLIRATRQRELAEAVPGAHLIEVDGGHNAWLVRPKEFNDALDDALSWVMPACASARRPPKRPPPVVLPVGDGVVPVGGGVLAADRSTSN